MKRNVTTSLKFVQEMKSAGSNVEPSMTAGKLLAAFNKLDTSKVLTFEATDGTLVKIVNDAISGPKVEIYYANEFVYFTSAFSLVEDKWTKGSDDLYNAGDKVKITINGLSVPSDQYGIGKMYDNDDTTSAYRWVVGVFGGQDIIDEVTKNGGYKGLTVRLQLEPGLLTDSEGTLCAGLDKTYVFGYPAVGETSFEPELGYIIQRYEGGSHNVKQKSLCLVGTNASTRINPELVTNSGEVPADQARINGFSYIYEATYIDSETGTQETTEYANMRDLGYIALPFNFDDFIFDMNEEEEYIEGAIAYYETQMTPGTFQKLDKNGKVQSVSTAPNIRKYVGVKEEDLPYLGTILVYEGDQ